MTDTNEGRGGRTLAHGRITTGPVPAEDSTTRRFFITTLTIKVLAEDAPWDGNIQWLSHDITEGEYVGDHTNTVLTEVTEAQMAEALTDAGSDPEFFGIEEGEPSTKQTYVVTAEGVE